jgi:hypothetical protein
LIARANDVGASFRAREHFLRDRLAPGVQVEHDNSAVAPLPGEAHAFADSGIILHFVGGRGLRPMKQAMGFDASQMRSSA